MNKVTEFIKNAFSVFVGFLQSRPQNDLEDFINFKKPKTKEELDIVIGQYEEMRRMESKLISRGQYGAAQHLKRMYWN